MGNVSRIKKKMNNVAGVMVDTGIAFGGNRLFLGVSFGKDPAVEVRRYQFFMRDMLDRARVLNMSDFYKAHFEVCERLKNGEAIV